VPLIFVVCSVTNCVVVSHNSVLCISSVSWLFQADLEVTTQDEDKQKGDF